MMTSQTREAIKEKLDETDRLSQDYQKRAGEYWKKQKFINLSLLSGIIFEVVLVFTAPIVDLEPKYLLDMIEKGDDLKLLLIVSEFIIAVFLGFTTYRNFVSGYIRKMEIHDFISMQYGLVAVELKALSDDENLSDDEVQRKLGELARRVTVITQWVKNNTGEKQHRGSSNLQAKPSPPPPSASPKNDKK